MIRNGTIMLVEDNEDDIELTLRAFKKCNIENKISVIHDGVAALEYLFAEDAGPNRRMLPDVVLLDLNLPK